MLDLFISILGWIVVFVSLGMFYSVLVRQDACMFIKYIFLCLFLAVVYIYLAYHQLKHEIDNIYQTKQYQYGCGVFLSHLSNGVGGRGGIIEKSNQLYKVTQGEIKGHCFFLHYQACKIEKDLKQGDKVCITYTKSKYKKEYHIYQIDLIK